MRGLVRSRVVVLCNRDWLQIVAAPPR